MHNSLTFISIGGIGTEEHKERRHVRVLLTKVSHSLLLTCSLKTETESECSAVESMGYPADPQTPDIPFTRCQQNVYIYIYI